MPTPYVGREFTFTNPDGTLVRVRGYGNQFAAVFETLDGFTVAKDPQTGFYHYAYLSPDGTRLEPTGPRVGTVEPAALDLPKHVRPAPELAREGARAAIRQTGVTPGGRSGAVPASRGRRHPHWAVTTSRVTGVRPRAPPWPRRRGRWWAPMWGCAC